AYRYRLSLYGQYLSSHPLSSAWEILLTLARMAVYRAAGWIDADKRLIEMRWDELTPEARRAYENAKAQVVLRIANRRS
ncbi:MAG: hypothetical protein NDJ72_13365, partial [Elusimicrobia bacterium]|nr:hypothetical protein [Elusimicrobiota bacterium]